MNVFIENPIKEEKIKVTSLEIIVTGTKDKPYFEIKYKEVGKEYYNIGYSSYDLNNVFGWKDECFEIVNQVEQEYNNGWIPCNERLPEYTGEYNVTIGVHNELGYYEDVTTFYFRKVKGEEPKWIIPDRQYCVFRVIAWRPLPEPYREKVTT